MLSTTLVTLFNQLISPGPKSWALMAPESGPNGLSSSWSLASHSLSRMSLKESTKSKNGSLSRNFSHRELEQQKRFICLTSRTRRRKPYRKGFGRGILFCSTETASTVFLRNVHLPSSISRSSEQLLNKIPPTRINNKRFIIFIF